MDSMAQDSVTRSLLEFASSPRICEDLAWVILLDNKSY